MKCPYCGYAESKVIDSRPADEGSTIRRRRECLMCAKRFTTYEKVERMPLVVVKRDKIESIADGIEGELQSALEREITTAEIGDMVMEQLKNVDEVSYVRFASVYRQFKDINTFMEELTKLLGDKTKDA